MRRRAVTGRELTAEELVQAVADAQAVHGLTKRTREQDYLTHRVLAALGYDPVDYLRARYWLRRGKPRGYNWRARYARERGPFEVPEQPATTHNPTPRTNRKA